MYEHTYINIYTYSLSSFVAGEQTSSVQAPDPGHRILSFQGTISKIRTRHIQVRIRHTVYIRKHLKVYSMEGLGNRLNLREYILLKGFFSFHFFQFH